MMLSAKKQSAGALGWWLGAKFGQKKKRNRKISPISYKYVSYISVEVNRIH